MKTKMFSTVRGRLTLWYLVILGLIFFISDVILYRTFKNNLLDTIDYALTNAAEDVETAIKKTPRQEWKSNVKAVERAFLVNRMFIQLFRVPVVETENFRLLARSGVLAGNISLKELRSTINRTMKQRTPAYLNVNENDSTGHPLRIILYPVNRGGKKEYMIQAGTSLKKVYNTLYNFRMVLLVSGPLLLLFSVLGGYLLLSKALGPVEEVVQTARRITTADLSLRIEPQKRKDEIGRLIVTFNDMISRLECSVQQIKQFSGDASHDLKTPLTVIRGEIELALRKKRPAEELRDTLNKVFREARKMERLVDNLLFLSRVNIMDSSAIFRPVQLDEVFLEVFEQTVHLARERGIAYTIKKMDSVSIEGEFILLSRLMQNIVDNSLKYTPEGGQVALSLEDKKNMVSLTVADTGIGIPEEDLKYVFDRFYRVDQARTQWREGSGLGLSIVKKIAELHHAAPSIKSCPAKGTTVVVDFRK
jgi:two-component system, OmpR family, sensor kinase